MREKAQFVFLGLFMGLVGVGGAFALTQPPNKIIPEQKMRECVENGGQYRVSDHSLRDDGSDYRMTCKIPEHKLWEIRY